MQKIKAFFLSHPVLFCTLLSLVLTLFDWIFLSIAVSPLYPVYSFNSITIDANFFRWTGKEILEGKTPYLDFYDHKGPLVFYFATLGQLIHPIYGHWVLDFVLHFFAFFFLSLAVSELEHTLGKILLADLLLLFGFAIGPGGYQIGDLFVPLASLSLYFGVLALSRKKNFFFHLGIFTCGIGIGMALVTRASDMIFFASFCIGYFVYWCYHIREQNYRLAIEVGIAIASIVLFDFPFYFIAKSQGYLEACFAAMFKDSFNYTHNLFAPETLAARIVLINVFVLVLLGYIRFFLKGEKKNRDIPTSLFVMSLVILLPHLYFAKYTQYWIDLYPFFIVLLLYYLHAFPLFKSQKISPTKIANITFSAFSFLIGIGYVTFYYVSDSPDFSAKYNTLVKEEIQEIIPEEEQQKKDNVLYLDCNTAVLLWFDNSSSLPYQTYQSWQAGMKKDIEPAVTAYLEEKKPKYVVCGDNGKVKKTFTYDTYIQEHYELISPKEKDAVDLYIYVLKDGIEN